MAHALVIIKTENDRQRVLDYIAAARIGTRVDIKGPRRTLPQNDRMWAMLTDIVVQKKTINGRRLTTDEWKSVFLHALGREQAVLPTLDGKSFFAVNHSSSDLDTQEMADLIDYIFAWGAENDVMWSDPALQSYEGMRR